LAKVTSCNANCSSKVFGWAGGGKKRKSIKKVVNLGMVVRWWKKYKEKRALKKRLAEEPDVHWIPRRFGDKIIMCPRANTSKEAKRYV
jgi:hypothetical protein